MYIEDFTGTYMRFQQHPKAIQWDNPRIKDYAYTLELALERQQFRCAPRLDFAQTHFLAHHFFWSSGEMPEAAGEWGSVAAATARTAQRSITTVG